MATLMGVESTDSEKRHVTSLECSTCGYIYQLADNLLTTVSFKLCKKCGSEINKARSLLELAIKISGLNLLNKIRKTLNEITY